MLTSLDFLTPGQTWPPKSERERLKRYRDNRLLFEGKHHVVFKEIWTRLFRNELQLSVEICLNWPKRLSTLWADLLLGEPPVVADATNDKNTDYLSNLEKDTSLWLKSYTGALDCSRFGDAVFKIRRDKHGKVKVSVIPPCFWFPVVSVDDAKEIEYHVIGYANSELGEGSTANKLHVEIHSDSEVIFRTYSLPINTGMQDYATIGNLIEERREKNEIGLNYVVNVSNLSTSDSIYGIDDYDDLTSIMQEIEVRFAQIARVLDKHADPKMYGPDMVTTDPETGVTRANFGDYIPIGLDGENPPGYITWDGHLDMSFMQIEKMMNQFFMLSETSPAMFGDVKNGLAESGSALKRLMMAPLAKVNRVRMNFDKGLREVLKVMVALDGHSDVVAEIDWQDGLPNDETERTQNEATAVSAGITSKWSAVKRLYSLSDKQADEEMALIDEESSVTTEPDNPLVGE
ncbi:MAG: phage portal protein [Synergistaceae bacterium]